MKQCSMCRKTKPFEEFYKSITNSGGYSNYCKPCTSDYDKKRYEAKRVHPEKNINGLIHCRRCNEYLDPSNFSKQKRYQSYCNSCRKHIGHSHNIKRYGISVDEYIEREKKQGGKCLICNKKDNKRLSIDHDHSCCGGENSCGDCIRGLICSRCNKTLGMVEDSVDLLQKMIKYLKAN